ncbi:MAG: hypothetical protein CMJ31_12320 [Phycisphaerae bacterium]|nr:hypothetical protein [Phycisphaerae bacterium]
MAEVWFAIPSASVERCRERLPAWRDMGYRIAVLQNVERGEIPADLVVWSDTYPGWAESINILCRDIVPASADIVVSGGDDMLPDPDRSAQQLAAEYFERFPDGFGVMQPAGDQFMWAQNYCGSPWFGRRFFETMYGGAGPMHGGYRHNWADYELYWVARCLGVLWMRTDATQYHAHFSREGEETPEWWKQNVGAADRADCELFLERKQAAFPGHAPRGLDVTFDIEDLLRNESGVAEWHLDRNHASAALTQPVATRVQEALDTLAARGARRVVIYGAGTHTLKAAQALASPPVDILAIADDDARRHGDKLWGYPIVALDDVERLRPDAIVLSSDSFEDKLWAKAAGYGSLGIDVIRLYAQTLPETSTPEEVAA